MNQTQDRENPGEATPPVNAKRLFPRVGRRILNFSGIFVLFVIFFWIRRQNHINQVPLIPEPFDVAAFLDECRVSDEENAMIDYRSASELFAQFCARNPANSFASNPRLPDTLRFRWPDAPQDVKDALSLNEPAIEKWLEGTRKPKCRNVPLEKLTFRSHNPEFKELDRIVTLALWKQCQLQDEGDFNKSWQIIAGGLRTGMHLTNDDVFLDRMIADSIRHYVNKHVIRWSEDPGVTSGDLRSALQEYLKVRTAILPASHALKTEYLVYRKPDAGLRNLLVYASDCGIHTEADLAQDRMEYIYCLLSGEYAYVDRLQRHLFANRIAHVDDPHRMREDTIVKVGRLLFFTDDRPKGAELPSSEIQKLAKRTVSLSWYYHRLDRFLKSADWDNSVWSAFEIVLALQLYHRDEGDFPVELKDLVPKYLEELPKNPYADDVDGTFNYRLEKDYVVLWTGGEYAPVPFPIEPFHFESRGDTDTLFLTVYSPGKRRPVQKVLPVEGERLEEVPPGEGK